MEWYPRPPWRGRLHQTRVDQHNRLASETTEEMEARLLQMSVDQHNRLASETSVLREARLQQLSIFQHDRLASKTIEERGSAVVLRVRKIRGRARHAAQTVEQNIKPATTT